MLGGGAAWELVHIQKLTSTNYLQFIAGVISKALRLQILFLQWHSRASEVSTVSTYTIYIVL